MLAGLATLLLPIGAFIGLILTVTGLIPDPSSEGPRQRIGARLALGLTLLALCGMCLWLAQRLGGRW